MRSRFPPALFVSGLLIALAGAGRAEAGKSNSHEADDRFSYALFTREDGNYVSTSGADWREVQALEKKDRPLLWFRLDDRTGVIRDPALLERAEDTCDEIQTLGAEQGMLGAKQGRLGAEQGRLGAEQGRLGLDQADASAELEEISYRIARAQRRDESTSDLERRRERLEARIRELSRRQRELGQRQRELGDQQSALGRQQSALGDLQGKAGRKAHAELEKIVNEAIRRGLVERK